MHDTQHAVLISACERVSLATIRRSSFVINRQADLATSSASLRMPKGTHIQSDKIEYALGWGNASLRMMRGLDC